MMFYTKYRRPDDAGLEPGGGKLIVERAGYIDTKTQIENFIRSGELLAAHRASFYEFPEQTTEDEYESRMPVPPIYPQDNVDVDCLARQMNSVREEIKAEKAAKAATAPAATAPAATAPAATAPAATVPGGAGETSPD